MKDFLKWLGVNEKVAKIVVWIMIAMIMLILTNLLLESMGLPFYKITVDNIKRIATNKEIINHLSSYLTSLLNFYCFVFLVFRIKEFKKIFPYSMLYMVVFFILMLITKSNFVVAQTYIFLGTLAFIFFYSKRKWKNVLYGALSIIINTVIQYLCYLYKVRFVDITKVGHLVRFIIGLDYFIIMFIIIMVKEIYLKKRSEKNA